LSKLRAVPANVNFRYRADEVVQLVANADAEALLHHRSLAERVARARTRLPGLRHTIEVDDEGGASPYEALIADHTPIARTNRSGDDVVLWYTGGTTGLPKGALWHQGTLVAHGLAAASGLHGDATPSTLDQLADAVRRWRADARPLGSLLTTPLAHATAVNQANTALATGGTVVLLERDRTDGDAICAAIGHHQPRLLEVVGDVLVRRIVRALDAADARGEPYDVSSLQRIHNSGAMVSAALKDALLARGTMHFYDSLGSSEGVGFGVALTTAPGDSETAHFRLGPNARVLADAACDADVVPDSGQVGVLAVHTSCAFAYHGDPESSAGVFRVIEGRLHAIPGDQATVDADGVLTLLGRGSQCVNSGGEKVWPEEVEEVLKEHPDVLDAVVIGVPDDEWGEVVAAVVATERIDDADADSLRAWVGARLAGYKRPRRIAFTTDLRRTTIGKVDYEWARRVLAPM
jgi:fatty-acyl-CoA synthase